MTCTHYLVNCGAGTSDTIVPCPWCKIERLEAERDALKATIVRAAEAPNKDLAYATLMKAYAALAAGKEKP